MIMQGIKEIIFPNIKFKNKKCLVENPFSTCLTNVNQNDMHFNMYHHLRDHEIC
jgi:hypothetical protein